MNFLVISAHDYRSRRKAGIHFVTAELEKRGNTRFFPASTACCRN
jgi:2-beta-glucuronyltransferase